MLFFSRNKIIPLLILLFSFHLDLAYSRPPVDPQPLETKIIETDSHLYAYKQVVMAAWSRLINRSPTCHFLNDTVIEKCRDGDLAIDIESRFLRENKEWQFEVIDNPELSHCDYYDLNEFDLNRFPFGRYPINTKVIITTLCLDLNL